MLEVYEMQESHISMDRVGVSFAENDVLTDFSLQIYVGEKVCIRGASGCGKSTVLRCLLGLIMPTQGKILIGTEELSSQSIWRLRTQMAWVPQEPAWAGLTVRDALERPFTYEANRAHASVYSRIAEWLERLNLSSALLEQATTDLSGGEKQRISLISALLLNRPILLMDEATSGLDEMNREQVRAILADLRDTTVLAVSHEAQAESWASRIVAMEASHA